MLHFVAVCCSVRCVAARCGVLRYVAERPSARNLQSAWVTVSGQSTRGTPCVSVCVCKRERVCVCVCVRERGCVSE